MSNRESLRQKAGKNMLKIEAVQDELKRTQKGVAQIVNSFNEVLRQVDLRVTAISEVIDAIVAVVGHDKVNYAIEKNRKEALKKKQAEEEVFLKDSLEAGDLREANDEPVGEQSYLVGRSLDAEGKETPPGRMAFWFGHVLADFKEKLLGEKVGVIVSTPSDVSFELTEHYVVQDEDGDYEDSDFEEIVEDMEQLPEEIPEKEDETVE